MIKYLIDPDGKYIGGFGGVVVKQTKTITVEKDSAPVDAVIVAERPAEAEGQPAMLDIEVPDEDLHLMPELPEGAIEVDAPPADAADVLKGFRVVDGQAVGGSWDTSARPATAPIATGGEKFAAAMVKAKIITQKQADDLLAELNQ